MKRTNFPVVTAPKTHFEYLSRVCQASSGPRPCIYGLRKLYWGVDAPIVKCCNYAFKVSQEVYYDYMYKLYKD